MERYRLMRKGHIIDDELAVGTIDEVIAAREVALDSGVEYRDLYFQKYYPTGHYAYPGSHNCWVLYNVM